jgi:hypothetical protein
VAKEKDVDLKQVMAEERSRGRSHPVRAENLELERRARRIARMILDKHCERRDYMEVIRADFGLKDESQEFQHYVKLWDAHRGKS